VPSMYVSISECQGVQSVSVSASESMCAVSVGECQEVTVCLPH